MAFKDKKKNLKLGMTVVETISNADDNFDTLFDNQDDLQTQIDGKEPKIASKGTAFNKNYSTSNPVMDGTATPGTADNVARGDHVHPTDTTRLAAAPDGKNNLLDSNNKINTIYLSDEVLGQLSYKGTWDAGGGSSSLTKQKGDYYICSAAGPRNPDATTATKDYAVGDWAVYNGTSWDKIDNTDAVTMVNGQIGSVKTYKGAYAAATIYYQGDIALGTDGCLYLYINANQTSGKALTESTYWKIFGKTYSNATTSAAGLMSAADKTNLDANTAARHSHSNKAILDTYDQTNDNLKDAVSKKHSHSNKAILDATTASYTTAEQTKLGKIDDSLLDKKFDDFGKVKDVKQNGTSVLNTSTGVADIIAGYVANLEVDDTTIEDGVYDKLKADSSSVIKYKTSKTTNSFRIYRQQEITAAGMTYICVDNSSDSLYQTVYEIFIAAKSDSSQVGYTVTTSSKNIEMTANKATSIEAANFTSDVKYPTTKAVVNYVSNNTVKDVRKRTLSGTSIVSNGIAVIQDPLNSKASISIAADSTSWQTITINEKTYYMAVLTGTGAPIIAVTNADGLEIVYQLKIENSMSKVIVAEKQAITIWYSNVTLG